MSKIKQIINCETNKKFILVDKESGFIRIPDVIFYLLLDDDHMEVCGKDIHEDLPQVGNEYEEGNDVLLGWLNKSHLVSHAKFVAEDVDDKDISIQKTRELLEKIKKIAPYINIDKDVEEF